jgi:hypothetical protein
MIDRRIIFRVHAIQRMFERQILVKNVRQALQTGEMIEDYSGDMPAPGGLVLGKHGQRPIHVVMAESPEEHELVVITVYEPDPSQWKPGFRHRKE